MSEERNVLLKDSFVLKFKNATDRRIIYRMDYHRILFYPYFSFREMNIKEKILIFFMLKEKHKSSEKHTTYMQTSFRIN